MYPPLFERYYIDKERLQSEYRQTFHDCIGFLHNRLESLEMAVQEYVYDMVEDIEGHRLVHDNLLQLA